MRVNAINNISKISYNKPVSFKHTAVPYPEFESAYKYSEETGSQKVSDIFTKISDFFNPSVRKEAAEIKRQINDICSPDKKLKGQLISVLA